MITEAVVRANATIPSRTEHVRAALELDFRRTERGTELFCSQQQPPLRVVRTFPLDDGGALGHLHNVSGGLLGGDELTLRVHVGEHARVQLTTTGATRIYRRRAEAGPAVQINEISVAPGGLLEYVPDQIIPFAESRFRQQTTIHLGEGAGLFWWEVLTPGREAGGELFAYEGVEMKTDIFAEQRPIACEHVCLEPARHDYSSVARMGEYRYWASFYICRRGIAPKDWRSAEDNLRDVAAQMADPGEVRWGVSTLVADGLAIRCLARRGHELFAALRTLWSEAKLMLYGREAIPPRKVN